MFKFEDMSGMKLKNIGVTVNQRESTRHGNFIKVNSLLILGLVKYHFWKKQKEAT